MEGIACCHVSKPVFRNYIPGNFLAVFKAGIQIDGRRIAPT